jgi:pyruvate formate lyase activating enzyme
VYFDVKIADPGIHQEHTGKTNCKILDNLCRLLRRRPAVVQPRIPLVPGVTATRENLSAIVDLLCEAGAESVSLLPYNPLGIDMTERLGRCRPALPDRFMNLDEEMTVHNIFSKIIERKERNNISPPTKTELKSY